MCYNIDIMEKGHWKIVVLVLIFLGLVGAGTLAIYQKLKLPAGLPDGEQAELSKIETAELEKPKQESENTEPKKELKKEEPKRAVPIKTPGKEAPKKEPKVSAAKESEVSAKPPEPEKPSMGISLADRDKKTFNWSLGLLAEANMNSPDGYAMGAGLYTLFMLPLKLKIGYLSLGARTLYSNDFKKHHIFDAALLFRWNFYDFSKIKERDSGFFIQLEGGVVFGLKEKRETSKLFMYALGEAAFGYRFTINNFFIEPYLRGGYPVIWAIGISGGYRI